MNASCDASLPFRRVTIPLPHQLLRHHLRLHRRPRRASALPPLPLLLRLPRRAAAGAPARPSSPPTSSPSPARPRSAASPAVWLSRLANLTELTVADTPLAATSSPTELAVVVSHMDRLTRLTVSNANLSGLLPHHWHCPNLTRLDLSANRIAGPIPDTLTLLAGITHLNLSSNVLTGAIPTSIGDLISLTTLDLSRNTLSGGVPDTVSTLPELEVLDLGSNRLNGSIPLFLTEMRGLRELNLENNDFDGVVPFGPKFLSRLRVFRAAGNAKLCYNRSVLAAEMAVGVAPCDKYGFPVLPPPATAQSERNADYDDGYRDPADAGGDARGGPSVAVLGVAIGLSCLAFLVILFVCICKVISDIDLDAMQGIQQHVMVIPTNDTGS
ncbi:hypothetical protein PR202_gb04747 [Eleusine coracana subsp. coracana]|uniref:Uncharacterized protein n=1 Tax=Eleusine coracana subsp. coracana TaxID=191504 RepID=A0AAV5E553_ELECO|nr:hypothetical protein PR202_gb04747 [Eleusine coracana subsp. coracana]